MMVKKEILVEGRKAILSYDDTMFGKDANTLEREGYTEAQILFPDIDVKAVLFINGEEYYSDSKDAYIDDFYFEVVDVNNLGNEMSCSEAIYQTIDNESGLIDVITSNSSFAEYKLCTKGFIAGYCDNETSENCEYSALNRHGLCGAECQDCMGEMFAYDKAYICECSEVLFEDRHAGIREI